MLPQEFIEQLVQEHGRERAEEIIENIQNQSPEVSIRLNPFKTDGPRALSYLPMDTARQTFSPLGYFLTQRPDFYLDPAFYAGAYYVQEASSMYLETLLPALVALRSEQTEGTFTVLDLCAAPGGKTTHLLSLLRQVEGSFLVSNEVIRSRANILCENVSKWGAVNAVVTCNDPADFSHLTGQFNLILVDAPCSGEGMFRKDPQAMEQWSAENVRHCAARQRRILSDVLPALAPGGLLVYSTCTFNRLENDDQVRWLQDEYGYDVLELKHFYLGDDRAGEGFFYALLRKPGSAAAKPLRKLRGTAYRRVESSAWVRDGYLLFRRKDMLKAFPEDVCAAMLEMEESAGLRVLMSGSVVGEYKESAGSLLLPQYSLIQSAAYLRGSLPEMETDREMALAYLRRENLQLPEAPLGYVVLTYLGVPLGLVKNIGKRCNSLLPPSLAIRKKTVR